jgi:hypothetical protein
VNAVRVSTNYGLGHARRVLVCIALTAIVSNACGKKGPPLPPLHLVPAAASDVGARRVSGEVRLRFVLPTTNLNGTGRIELDRVEIYAMTIPAGAIPPANRELLTTRFVVGTVAIKPPPVEGEPVAETPNADTRPAPGETVTFTEKLTDDKLKPTERPGLAKEAAARVTMTPPGVVPLGPTLPGTVVPQPSLPGTAPSAVAVPPPPVTFPYPVRIYAVRGLTKGGRAGQPSPRVQVPLVADPPPATAVVVEPKETTTVVSWTPASALPEGSALSYNVYKSDATAPLNPQPLTAPPFERPGVEFGTEQCFTVRTVAQFGTVAIESDASAATCVTPRDTFAPAAPKGLDAVADPGVVNLIWEPNTESDLGGYLILRGEAPGDKLQSLISDPIRETNYSDKTVKPGVRYVYAAVAVDKASPPNRSGESPRHEVTAR